MKKTYLTPKIKVTSMNLQQLIAFSGGGVDTGDPQIDEIPDEDDGPNRAPHYFDVRSVWDD